MHPNADDGLVPDITELFRRDFSAYRRNAEEHTLKHAILHGSGGGGSGGGSSLGSGDERGIAIASNNSRMDKPSEHTTMDVCTDNTTTNASVNTTTSDSYQFESDGFTLIGCVSGSIGEVLYVSAINSVLSDVDTEYSSAVNTEHDSGEDEEGEGGGKRQRVV